MGMMVFDAVFAQKVARFIRYDSATRKNDKVRAKILVDKFGVTNKDVRSWATGMAASSLMKRKEIEEFMDSWKE